MSMYFYVLCIQVNFRLKRVTSFTVLTFYAVPTVQKHGKKYCIARLKVWNKRKNGLHFYKPLPCHISGIIHNLSSLTSLTCNTKIYIETGVADERLTWSLTTK